MYKIIQDEKIIDVIRIPNFVSFLPTGHIAMSDKASATGIVGSDGQTVYSFSENNYNKQIVKIEKITVDEFNRLKSLLNSEQNVNMTDVALEKAKQSKVQSLSNICKNRIISGFSVKLSDGIVYKFKLTVEDQLNLMILENQLSTGAKSFIYHATDMPCKVYNKEDMTKIINAFKVHTLYHTTYFNVAKQYIKSLTDIEKIQLFAYGQDISWYVKDKTIKQIIKNGENTYNESTY